MATLTTSYQLLGSVKTSTYSQLRLYGKYNSQSTDNNTSSVSLQLRLYGNGGKGSFSSGTAKISGTSYSLGNTSYSKNAEKTLCTKTYTATHSSDGTYTASISYSISTTGTISGSSSASITLPQIKRTSVLGNISNFTFGNSIPITYTEYVSSYTANLKVIIGSTTVKTINNISSGTSISFTSGELNTIYGLVPNATTTSVTFQLVTMNGSTQIGTNSKSATGTISSSVKPTISSVVLEDSLGYKQQIGNYVQHKSKIHGTISSSGGTGSGISSIETQINGETIYGNNFYTKGLATSGTNSYTVRVTDTRGRSATYTGSFSVISYSAPIINFNVYRSNSSGNQDDNGNYICINVNASIDSLNNENSKEFKIEYRQGSGSWTTLTTYNTSYNYVLTNSVYSGFSSSYPFDVRLTATDRFGSEYAQIWIPTAKTVLDFYHDGTGVAIGKVADTANKFDVAYNTEIESNLTVDGELYLAGMRVGHIVNGQRLLECSGTNGTSGVYIKLCHISLASHIQGRFNNFRIFIGYGNNGRTDQQAYIDLTLQQSWEGDGGRFGGTWELHPMKTSFSLSNTNILVISSTNKEYDVWFYTTIMYCRPSYIYNVDEGTTITHIGNVTQTTAPSGTLCNVEGVVKSVPIVLYNDSTGTNGSVTLSSSAGNYTYLEIFYRGNDNQYSSVKVYSPNGKQVSLLVSLTYNSRIYFKQKIVNISGTSISNVNYSEGWFNGSNQQGWSNYNNIYITRVLGYY